MPNKAIIWNDGDGNGIVLHCQACGRKSHHRPCFPKLTCKCTLAYELPVELCRAYVVDVDIDEELDE